MLSPVWLAVVLLTLLCGERPAQADHDPYGVERPKSITVVSDDNYPPYIFRSEEGQIQGLLVDQWKAWEKATGVRVELKAMNWDDAKQFMRAGKADVIDTIFFNEERAKIYDFTKPYARLDVPVFVHKTLGGISSVQSLRGFNVGVKAGDAVIDVLKQYGIHSVKEYDSYKDIINAARTGDIRVFSIDEPPALYYLYKYELEGEFRQAFVLYSGEFHRAVRKGDEALLRLVEQGFAAIPGGESRAIEEKWLGAPLAARYDLRLLLTIVGAVAALALALTLFVLVLRRRVRSKTAELAQALALLRESELLFRTMVETASEGIVRLDEQSAIAYVNDTMANMLGYVPEEMLDRQIMAFLFPEDRETFGSLLGKHTAGTSGRSEQRFQGRNGEEIWTLASASALYDEVGKSIGCFGMFTDITERKRVEEALLQNRERLQLALDAANDGLWDWRLDTGEAYFSPRYYTMLGYEPDEFPAGFESFSALLHPDDLSLITETVQSQLMTSETNAFEIRMRAKSGEWKWILTRSRVVDRDSSGRPTRLAGTHTDITERKRTEADLRESEERYRSVIQNMHDTYYRTDAEGRLVMFSPSVLHLLGYDSMDEVLGHKAEEFYATPGGRRIFLEKLSAEGVLRDYEVPLVRKDGSVLLVATTSSYYRDKAGNILGVEGIFRDISDQKRAEEALTEAKDAADAANRAKSEFLANMSHEIRTPLNGIVGMLQLLSSSDLDEVQKRYAQAAIQSSQRLTNLLGDILDLSRIEARKFELELKAFALADVLESVETLYRAPAGQKGVALRLHVDPDLPKYLSGDEHRLRQVLFNLVGNAVKFTKSGEISVEVEGLMPRSTTRCRVRFVISDTGEGIPFDKLDQAFQMFTQVEGSLSRSHQGAGLGLAIVRHLVTLMGGPGIDVSSGVGQGTTFSFVLPFDVPAQETLAQGEPEELLGEVSLAGLRVLLVEDEEINQLALRTGLERKGVAVTCASSGVEALENLRQGEFDCVLMDIHMPGMNGVEATTTLRTSPEYQHIKDIPVIALTAFAMAGDRERFLAAGMDAYLSKPVSFEDLTRILGRIRRRRPSLQGTAK